MRLTGKVTLIVIAISVIASCSLTPAKNTDQNLDDPDFKKADIPEVSTQYKPKFDLFKKKDKPVMAESYSLEQVQVSKKKNGILIRFKYEGDNPKENISTFFSGDRFFNITFFKGKFGSDIKQSFYNGSIIENLQFFEFEESVQITVRLKDDHKSNFIQTDDDYITISVFS